MFARSDKKQVQRSNFYAQIPDEIKLVRASGNFSANIY